MFWLGLLIGGLFGLIFGAIGQLCVEKTAVENKIVKLNGKYYEITEIEK